MRRKLLGFVCGIFLSLQPLAQAEPDRVTDEDLAIGYARVAWLMACEAKRVDCSGLDAIASYAPMPSGLLGLYPRVGPLVLVNMKLYAKPESAVVATHEFIHRIQSAEGWLGDSCAREREAFELTYAMNEKYKVVGPEGAIKVVRWADAARMYRCPA